MTSECPRCGTHALQQTDRVYQCRECGAITVSEADFVEIVVEAKLEALRDYLSARHSADDDV